jgi:aspartate ammonia-lyase
MGYRIEKDFIGELKIDADRYWGIHTQRAKNNFKIGSCKVHPSLIRSIAMVKKACCEANEDLDYIDKKIAAAIKSACDEIIQGKFDDQFPLDAFQGGAGTSTNMNVNEVIANRALELLGYEKGEYDIIHPLLHVNLHQSTNDIYPTALKIASIYALRNLSSAIAKLQGTFQKKEKAFAKIVKIGRTELQEAVPITLGSEFSAFAEAISRDRWRQFKSEERLRVVNIGGTAVGTGLTAPRDYIFLVIEKLRDLTGLGITRGENVMGETANSDPFVEVSGILKAHASNLIKISNDLRLLNFLGEIELPKVQSGSSIMPGKVNPVIAESVIQAALKVIANDSMITETATRSTFQINEFLPLLAYSILDSLEILFNVNTMLATYVEDIEPNEKKCREYLDNSPMLITAFLPELGYDNAEILLKKFRESGYSDLRSFLKNELGEELVEDILSPYKLTALGYRRKK